LPSSLVSQFSSFPAFTHFFFFSPAILTVNLSESSYGFQLFYRVYLAVYLLGLLAVALVFAVQMLLALVEVQALSDEFRRRRRRLAVN
jgi:hypothetical protein